MERCHQWLHIFPVGKVVLLIVTILIADHVSLCKAADVEVLGNEEVDSRKKEEYIVLIKNQNQFVAMFLKKIPVAGYVVERNGYDIVCKREKEAKTYGTEPGDRIGGDLYFTYFLRPSSEGTWCYKPEEIKIKVEVWRRGRYVLAAQDKTYKRDSRDARYKLKERHQCQLDDILASLDKAMRRISDRWIDFNDSVLGHSFDQRKMQVWRSVSPGAENQTFNGTSYNRFYARHTTFFGAYEADGRPVTKSWLKIEGERTVQLGKELLQRAADLRDGFIKCCIYILNSRRNTKMRVTSDAFTLKIIIEGPPLPFTMKGVRSKIKADYYRPNYNHGHYSEDDDCSDHTHAVGNSKSSINIHPEGVGSAKKRIQIHSEHSEGDHQRRGSYDTPDRQSYSKNEDVGTEIDRNWSDSGGQSSTVSLSP